MSTDGKKFLITGIIIFIIAVIIAVSVGVVLYTKNVEKTKKAYEESSQKYNKVINVVEMVNNKIEEKIAEGKEYLETNPDVGEDKTLITKLETAITELENLKIEVAEKFPKLDELNSSIEKMLEKIKDIDEGLVEYINQEEGKVQTTGDLIDQITSEDNTEEMELTKDSKLEIALTSITTIKANIEEKVVNEAEKKAVEAEKNEID